MKIISFSFSIMLLLIGMVSCKGEPAVLYATGSSGDVIVVMDKSDWNGPAGIALNELLSSSVPGLPQAESVMDVTYVEPGQFDKMYQMVRNIVMVNIDPGMYTKVSMKRLTDKWARNQEILMLNAPDTASLRSFVLNNDQTIIDYLVTAEMDRSIKTLRKTYSTVIYKNIKKTFGVEIKSPESIKFYKDTTNFYWASNNSTDGRCDIIVYSFPYSGNNTFTKEYLLARRDSVMKTNVHGSFDGSYMTTENRFETDFKQITVNGKFCAEIRGLWKMKGDIMGGPFISHARLDERKQRVIVAEGFVYAPGKKKRDFIRQIEAVLYTMKLSDDGNTKS